MVIHLALCKMINTFSKKEWGQFKMVNWFNKHEEEILKRDILGGGVAELVEHRTQNPKDEGSNPAQSARKMYEFFRVTNVLLTRCRCAQPPCVYARTRTITYAR